MAPLQLHWYWIQGDYLESEYTQGARGQQRHGERWLLPPDYQNLSDRLEQSCYYR